MFRCTSVKEQPASCPDVGVVITDIVKEKMSAAINISADSVF